MYIKHYPSKVEMVFKNTIWGLILTAISAVFPFLIRMTMAKNLGSEYLGLNSYFTSIIELINVVNLGMDSAMAFYLYEPFVKRDFNLVNNIINLYKKIYIYMGILIALIGIVVCPFLGQSIKADAPKDVNIYVVYFVFLCTNLTAYFFSTYWYILLRADMHDYYIAIITSVQFIIQYLLQLLFIIKKYYYAYLLVMIGGAIFSAIGINLIVKQYYPYINRDAEEVNSELKNSLKKDILSIAIYKIRTVSRNSLDSVILSSLLGLVELAKYQNYYLVMTVPLLVRNAIVQAITSVLGNYNASASREEVYKKFKTILFLQLTISGLFSIVFYSLIQDFIVIWMGSEYLLPQSTIVAITIYIYVLGMFETIMMVRSSLGYWDKGRKNAVLESLMNIVLNIFLAKMWGTTGIVVATVISICLICLPHEVRVVIGELFKENTKQTVFIIIKNMIWMFLAFLIVSWVCRYVPEIHFWRLIIKAGISIVLPAIILFLLYIRNEQFRDFMMIIKR